MKLKTAKTLDDIVRALSQPQPIERTPIEITEKNGSITAVRIAGLHVSASYGLEVLEEVKFEEATRYRMTADVPGVGKVVEYFEDFDKALERKREFGDHVDANVDTGIKVLVDEGGDVVGEVGDGAQSTTANDDLTF